MRTIAATRVSRCVVGSRTSTSTCGAAESPDARSTAASARRLSLPFATKSFDPRPSRRGVCRPKAPAITARMKATASSVLGRRTASSASGLTGIIFGPPSRTLAARRGQEDVARLRRSNARMATRRRHDDDREQEENAAGLEPVAEWIPRRVVVEGRCPPEVADRIDERGQRIDEVGGDGCGGAHADRKTAPPRRRAEGKGDGPVREREQQGAGGRGARCASAILMPAACDPITRATRSTAASPVASTASASELLEPRA